VCLVCKKPKIVAFLVELQPERFQSQARKGKPLRSMKFPQRGQRPGSRHGSTEWSASTGQVGLVSRQISGAGGLDEGFTELAPKMTGGISGR